MPDGTLKDIEKKLARYRPVYRILLIAVLVVAGIVLIVQTQRPGLEEWRWLGWGCLGAGLVTAAWLGWNQFNPKVRRLRRRDKRRAAMDPIAELDQQFDELAERCLNSYERAMEESQLVAVRISLVPNVTVSHPDVHVFELDELQRVLIPALEPIETDDGPLSPKRCYLNGYWMAPRWRSSPYLLPGSRDEAIDVLSKLIEQNKEKFDRMVAPLVKQMDDLIS